MSEPLVRDCVLVVESDLIIRQPLAEYLRQCGFKVFEAVDTDEATVILSDDDLSVDMILCDVHGPGKLDGFGLSRWVRARNLPIQVILSGSVERTAQKAGDLCENGGLFKKPYDHAALLDRIKRSLAHRDRSAR